MSLPGTAHLVRSKDIIPEFMGFGYILGYPYTELAMKEYRCTGSRFFPIIVIGIYCAAMTPSFLNGTLSVQAAAFVGIGVGIAILISHYVTKAMITDFRIDDTSLQMKNGYSKEWTVIPFQEIRQVAYSKVFRKKHLYIRNYKAYEEYNILLGVDRLEEFLQDLKTRLGEKYSEGAGTFARISNYLPS